MTSRARGLRTVDCGPANRFQEQAEGKTLTRSNTALLAIRRCSALRATFTPWPNCTAFGVAIDGGGPSLTTWTPK